MQAQITGIFASREKTRTISCKEAQKAQEDRQSFVLLVPFVAETIVRQSANSIR